MTTLMNNSFTPWYPRNKNELEKYLTSLLDNTDTKPNSNIQAIIVPHAGYQYSGPNAACAFKTIQNNSYEQVIVFGPSHQLPLSNKLVVPTSSQYETALGKIDIDTDLINKLPSNYFIKSDDPFITEHSVDNEIPFIQHLLKNYKIIPMIVGQLDKETFTSVASTLKELMSKKTLIVVSSDFTHYGEGFGYVPFKDNIEQNLEKLDMEAAQIINELDFDKFLSFKQLTGATICGCYPILLLLKMLNGNSSSSLVNYYTSGTLSGDFSHSVSYLAFTFEGSWN